MALVLTLALQLAQMNFSLNTVFPSFGLSKREQGSILFYISVLFQFLFVNLSDFFFRSDIEKKKQELRLMVG